MKRKQPGFPLASLGFEPLHLRVTHQQHRIENRLTPAYKLTELSRIKQIARPCDE